MSILHRKMPSFEGVAGGQTATCSMPVGNTYHKLYLTYSGVTLAQMTEIRLMANGKPIQRWLSGEVLDAVNQFDGRNAANGVLTLDLERYGLRTRANTEVTAIGTGKHPQGKPVKGVVITSFNLEVDIDAAAASPVLELRADQSNWRPPGLMKHVRVFGKDPSGAGDYEIADLSRLGLINRVIFKSASAAVNSIKLERDGFTVHERTKAQNEVIQSDGVRVPQTGYYILDRTEEGNGDDSISTAGVRDLRFTLNMAGAGHVDAITEYIAPLGN